MVKEVLGECDGLTCNVVKIKANIPSNAIISEYSYQVLNEINEKKWFDYRFNPYSEISLVIIPEKYWNLGRFLSWINNSK